MTRPAHLRIYVQIEDIAASGPTRRARIWSARDKDNSPESHGYTPRPQKRHRRRALSESGPAGGGRQMPARPEALSGEMPAASASGAGLDQARGGGQVFARAGRAGGRARGGDEALAPRSAGPCLLVATTRDGAATGRTVPNDTKQHAADPGLLGTTRCRNATWHPLERRAGSTT